MAWQLTEAETLASQPQPEPTAVASIASAMATTIEACPTDFLEPLMTSPFGRVYKLFMERCCRQSPDSPVAIQLRERLSQRLRSCGFQGGEGHGLLLALMLFYGPGSLKVEDAASKLPGWLLELYRQRYESNSSDPAQPTAAPASGEPSFTDRIFLNRMLGLSNLYYIDPDDKEILQELRQVRLQTVDLILSASKTDLGNQFSADFGDRFWAMAQSGIQKEPLDAIEVAKRDAIQHWLSTTPQSLHAEGGIQRFAAALLFSLPGSVRLANPEQNLPAWFLEGFRRFSSMALG
jgi:hypothetical protein